MPYQRNRALSGLSKGNRAGLIAGIVLAVLIVALLIFYLAAPRDCLQLLLPKSTYTEVLARQNLKRATHAVSPVLERLQKKTAYTTDGEIDYRMTDNLSNQLGGKAVSSTIEEYMDTLSFSATQQMQDGSIAISAKLKDSQGDLANADALFGDGRLDANIQELGLGWVRYWTADSETAGTLSQSDPRLRALLGSEGNVQKYLLKDIQKGLRSVAGDLTYEMGSDYRFSVGNKTFQGDRETLLISKKNAEDFLLNTFAYLSADKRLYKACNAVLDPVNSFHDQVAFQRYLQGVCQELIDRLEGSQSSRMAVDLGIDSRNRVQGVNALVKRTKGDGDVSFNWLVKDDKDRGCALKIRTGGKPYLGFELTRKNATSGTADVSFRGAATQIRYSDFQKQEDLVYGRFQMSSVTLPNMEGLGPVAFDLTLKPASGKLLREEGRFDVAAFGTFVVGLDVTESEYHPMAVPTQAELTVPTPQAKFQAIQNYLLVELPKNHRDYSNMVHKILNFVQEILIDQRYGKNLSGRSGQYQAPSLPDAVTVVDPVSGDVAVGTVY